MGTTITILTILLGLSTLLNATGKDGVSNPCTAEAIELGQLYHRYPQDPRRFIQCTEWGKAYVRLCPVGETWFQPYLTCVDMEHDVIMPPTNGKSGKNTGNQGQNGMGKSQKSVNGNGQTGYGPSSGNGNSQMPAQKGGNMEPWEHYMKLQIGQSKITDSQMMNQGQQQEQSMNGHTNNNGQQTKSMGQNGHNNGNGNHGKSWGQNGQANGDQGKSWGQNGQTNGNNNQGKSWGHNGQGNVDQGKSWGQNGQGNGDQGKSWGSNDKGNGDQGKSSGQNGKSNGNQGKSWGQNGQGNGNQGKSWGQNGQGNGDQGKSWGQNGQDNGDQGKSWGQNGQDNGDQGKSWGQNGQSNGNQGKSWGQNAQGNGDQGKSWGQNGQGNGDQGKSWGQNGQGNGDQGKSWGQNGQDNGDQGKSWGQNGQTNGDNGHSNGNSGKSWGTNDETNKDTSNNGNSNMGNPCYDPNVQFIAHPTNPYKFFECEDGNLVLHQCEFYHVWDQDTMSCVSLEKEEPIDETNGDGTTEALPNPCVGSTQKFHPYPNDPHKFIECMTWYSMQVWDCGSEAVWMQDKQVCALVYENGGQNGGVDGNGGQNGGGNGNGGHNGGNGPVYPTEPSTTTATTPDQTPGDNICQKNSQFYHAYPEDPHKFIQCDDHGNMFIRQCGLNKLWSEVFLTCVAATTGTPDGKDSSYPPKQNGNGIVTMGDEDVSVTIDSTVFVSDLNSMCPEHEYFDHDAHSCKPIPSTRPVHTQPMNMVIMDDWSYSSCPRRFEWNSEQGACVETEPIPEPRMEQELQDCEPGFVWDAASKMCIQAINTNSYKSHSVSKPKPIPYNPDYQIIDRGGLTPDGYIEDYGDLDDDLEFYNDDGENGDENVSETPTYEGPNPCITSYGFFLEFPGNPRFYIQCDEWRQMHVQACPYGLSWDPAISTCLDGNNGHTGVDTKSSESGNKDQYTETMNSAAKSGYNSNSQNNNHMSESDKEEMHVDLNALLNPCKQGSYSKSDTPSNYHPHPFDPRRFIVCSNGTPYIMICPHSSVWDASLHTCVASVAHSNKSPQQAYKSVSY